MSQILYRIGHFAGRHRWRMLAAWAVVAASAVMLNISFGGDPDESKMFGVGLALAIVFDVTLVRMVLVPAVMSLLGHRAWWLPSWLDRLVPRIDVEGSDLDSSGSDVEHDAATQLSSRHPSPDRVGRPCRRSTRTSAPASTSLNSTQRLLEVLMITETQKTNGEWRIAQRCRSSCSRWPPSSRRWLPSTSQSRRSPATPTPPRPSCPGSSTPTRSCSPPCCSSGARSATATVVGAL